MTLTVPAGALHEERLITLTPLSGLDGSPLPNLIGALDLQPEGLHFLTPAMLSIPRPEGLLDREIAGFGFVAGGSGFHLAPRLLSADTIVLRVLHFSGHGASRATLTEINRTLGYEPTPAQDRAAQEIAAAEFLAAEDGSDPSPRIKAALLYWFDHSVSTGLGVVGDSLDNLELALGEWVAWKSLVEYYHLGADGDVATRMTSGTAAATTAAAHIADLVLSTCTGGGSDPLAPLRLAVRLRADLEVVPLPIETRQTAGGRQLPSALELVNACAHVEIEGTTHPPVLAFLRDNSYTADAGVVFWNGSAPNHSIPLVFTLFDETDNLPMVSPTEVLNGHLVTTIQPTTTGNHDLHLTVDLAAAADDELLEGLLDQRHDFVDVRSRLDLESDADPVQAGTATTIHVRTAGDGMANATVTLTATKGQLSAASVTTDAAGEASVIWTAPDDGSTSASITADFGDSQDVLPLTIGQTPIIEISPTTTSVATGRTVQFTATVTNVADTSVTWQATGGTVSSTGLYTAGSSPGAYSVSATTVATPQRTATATITVFASGSVAVTFRSQFASASASAIAERLNQAAVQDGMFLQDPFSGLLGSHSSVASATAAATGDGGASATGSAQSTVSATVSITGGRLLISGTFGASAASSQSQGSVFDPAWGITRTMSATGEASANTSLFVQFTVSTQAITLTCSGSGRIEVRGSPGTVLLGPGTVVLQPGAWSLSWNGHAAAKSSPPGINDGIPDSSSSGGELSCSS
jgi:hypothetical protein